MRITDFSRSKLIARRRRKAKTVSLLLAFHLSSIAVVSSLISNVESIEKRISASLRRSIRINLASFNLNAWSDDASLIDFRFLPQHVALIARILDFPGDRMITGRSRYNASSIEATAILLRRLASPVRWSDLEELFGRRRSALFEIYLETLRLAHRRLRKHLDGFRSELVESRAARYAAKIREKGSPLDRCVGFIDGTAIRISRPTRGQQSCYSGHKRCHALKHQSIVGPDGLFLHFWGPLEGRRHDMTLYRRSGMDQLLEQFLLIHGQQHYLYGDPAHVLRPWLQKGFAGAALDAGEASFNREMNRARESVEWGFKDIKQLFSSNDHSRQMRALKSPIGLMMVVSSALTNI